MSKEVDYRVVEMQFDNKDFEKNTKESMSTLDKLKKALNMDGVEDGFNKISKSAKKTDLSPVTKGLVSITDNFSLADLAAARFFVNIIDDAYRAGKALVKSLSIDQVTAGWDKYIAKNENVQVIMNATGLSVDAVNAKLYELMRVSDETSYSFGDMTTALSTMLAKGADIDNAIPMIVGIAEATAYAGKTGFEFQRTINNLVQSYSAGFLNLQDWKSVQLAGTNSKKLVETLIKAGVELKKIDEGEVTVENFNESLKDKWADAQVMERAFGGWSSLIMDAIAAADSGAYETVTEAIEDLAGGYEDYVVKATEASQASKSFKEAVDATKDAVSTGWMTTFEILIGDYEQAKSLWTDFGEYLYEVFAKSSEARNDWLKEVTTLTVAEVEIEPYLPRQYKRVEDFLPKGDIDVRSIFLDGIFNVLYAIKDVIDSIRSAFSEMFPAPTALEVYEFAKAFSEFTAKLRLSEETAGTLKSIFRGIFAVFDIFGKLLRTLGKGASDFMSWLFPGVKGIFNFSGGVGELLVKLDDAIDKSGLFSKALEGIKFVLRPIGNALKFITGKIIDFAGAIFGIDFSNFDEWVQNVEIDLKPVTDFFTNIGTKVKELFGNFNKLIPIFDEFKKGLKTAMETVVGWFKKGFEGVKIDSVDVVHNGLLGGILYVLYQMLQTVKTIKSSSITGSIKTLFGSIASYFSELQKNVKAERIKPLADAILEIAAAMLLMSLIPEDKILQAIAVVAVIGEVVGSLIEKMNEPKAKLAFSANFDLSTKMFGIASALKSIGKAMLLIAVAAAILTTIPTENLKKIGTIVISLVAILGGIALALAYLSKDKRIDTYGRSGKSGNKGTRAVEGRLDYESSGGKVAGIGRAIMGLALGVLIVVAAAKLLDTIDATKLTSVMTEVKGIIRALALAAALIVAIDKIKMPSKSMGLAKTNDNRFTLSKHNDKTVAGPVLAIAGAILVIAYAAKMIAETKGDIYGAVTVIGLISLVLESFIILISVLAWASNKADNVDMSSTKALVGSLKAIAAIVAVFALIIKLITSIPEDQVWKAYGVLAAIAGLAAGIFVALGGFALLLGWADSKLGGVIEKFAKSMLMFSGALAVFGLALILLAEGVLAFSALGGAGAVIFDKLGASFGALTKALAKGVVEAAPDIAEAFVVVSHATLIGWIKAFNDIAPDMLEGLYDATMRVLALLKDQKGQDLIDALMDVLITIVNGLSNKIDELVDALTKVLSPIMRMFASMIVMDIGALGLLGFVGIMALVFKALNAIKKNALSAVGVAVAIALTLGVIGGVIYLLQENLDFGKAVTNVGLCMAVLVVSALIIALLGKLKINVGSAFMAALDLIAFIGLIFIAFGALAWGIAEAMDHFGWDLKSKVESGFEVLKAIAAGLGEVIGAFFGGIVGGYQDGKLQAIGADADAMGEGFSGFGSSMDGISSDTIQKIKDLATVMLALTAAELIDGIKNFVGIKSDFGTLAAGLPELGDGIMAFQEHVKDIDNDKLQPGLDAVQKLAELSEMVPKTGGFLQWIVGEVDLEKFGTGLSSLGKGVLDFQNASEGVDKEAVDYAASCADVVVELSKKIPLTGGVLDMILGNNDVDVFGSKLKDFGQGLSDFTSASSKVNATTVGRATKAGEAIVALANSIPQTEDGWLISHTDIAEFGGLLKEYATMYKETAAIFQEAEDADAIGVFTRANTMLSDLIDTAIKLADNYDGVHNFYYFFNDFLGSLKAVASQMETANGQNDLGGILASNIVLGMDSKKALMENAASEFFGKIGTAATNSKTGIIRRTNELIQAIVQAIRKKRDQFREAGVYVMEGFKQGFTEGVIEAEETVGGGAVSILDRFNDDMGIMSPSWKFAQSASYAIAGFVKGWLDNAPQIQNAVSETGLTAVETIDSAVATVHDILESTGDLSPTIRPVVDTTYAAQGAAAISSLFNEQGMRFDFSAFNRNARAIRALEGEHKTRVSVERKQPEVVNAINELRDHLDAIDNDIMNMQVVLDSGKTVGGIHKKMDKKLGTTVRDKKRGIR